MRIRGLFGRFDMRREFDAGINVVYGRNGSGKTTLLHILANVLNGDFDRFAFLSFKSILVEFDDRRTVKIRRIRDRDDVTGIVEDLLEVDNGESSEVLSVSEIESREPIFVTSPIPDSQRVAKATALSVAVLPMVYFPAFRTAIEAWKSVQAEPSMCTVEQATHFARRWLLPFVPRVDYPTLREIEEGLAGSSTEADTRDRVDQYLECVNSFLKGKKLAANSQKKDTGLPPVDLEFSDGTRAKLGALSSGERQIVTLMYAATQVDSHKILLVDEPEISLHVAWQRQLLRKMANLFQYRQIIACTHSPVVRADYPDTRLELVPTSKEDEEIPL